MVLRTRKLHKGRVREVESKKWTDTESKPLEVVNSD